MKLNKLGSGLFYTPLVRVGLTAIITLLSWSGMTSKAKAGFDLSAKGAEPPEVEVEGGSIQALIEGSDVFGDGSILTFDEFSIIDNSNLPDNVISNGDGSLLDLVNTAGDVWTQALPEFEDIQINVAWADFGLVSLASPPEELPSPLEELASQLQDQNESDLSDLIEGFERTNDLFLLTSMANPSITNALTFVNPVTEAEEFILEQIPDTPDEEATFNLLAPSSEINEFEETFISISPEETEIDGLAAIFIPVIFEEDGTIINQGEQFPSSGTIVFNSQEDLEFDLDGDGTLETIQFFLDDNPLDSEVFGSATTLTERDGEGSLAGINIGRSSFADNSQFPLEQDDENVFVVDLFSVALHELQHALGTTRTNPEAIDDDSLSDGNIVTNDGNEIPTDFEPFIHIALDTDLPNTPTPVGLETVTFGERKCPSAVDVLAVAEVGFDEGQADGQLSLNPCADLATAPTSVPESSTIVPLLIFGAGGLLATRRRLISSASRLG
ncbi:MAG: hypothetical protein QNJ70_24865 [Xenococcaceae cyanobacterium MO_207.B15]|nr:hypothetical protein [Xenococcaceae cyanobacterium MO_207.B15]